MSRNENDKGLAVLTADKGGINQCSKTRKRCATQDIDSQSQKELLKSQLGIKQAVENQPIQKVNPGGGFLDGRG